MARKFFENGSDDLTAKYLMPPAALALHLTWTRLVNAATSAGWHVCHWDPACVGEVCPKRATVQPKNIALLIVFILVSLGKTTSTLPISLFGVVTFNDLFAIESPCRPCFSLIFAMTIAV